MLKRILGLLGWLGVALVFAAVAMRNLRPEWGWWYTLAIAGLVCVLLYVLSQWREIVRDFSGRQARYGSLALASIAVVLGILIAIGSDEEGAGGHHQAGSRHRLRPHRGLRSVPSAAR
jgi:hypothetical protein